MIKFFLLLAIPFFLHGAKILSYNIYERTDRVDVMITFDTPYDGVIKQNTTNSVLTIKLENASIESSKVKQLSSKFIRSIAITPMSDHTQVVAEIPPNVVLQASKTSDAYGLRLRFATPTTASQNSSASNDASSDELASLPTKKDDLSQSYYIVLVILILGIIVLFFIKKRVILPQAKQSQSSWLFQENQDETNKVGMSAPNMSNMQNVTIRFQKALNSDNSVVMLDFGEQSYLVMMGRSNILLDKFSDNKPVTEDDFNSILQNRHKELEKFLNSDNKHQESLRIYKEKAASISYES